MDNGVGRARGAEVPPAARAQLTLRRVDYVDQHVLTAEDAQSWSAQEWARAMFEDERPRSVRARELGLLGLMLSPPQPPGAIAGWTITHQDAPGLRMVSESANTRDEVVVRTDGRRVTLLVAVEYRRRLGALTWPVTAILHRRFAPRVLRRAAARLRAT